MISDQERKLVQKLQKKAYRRAYVSEHVRRGIAHQIRALREEPSREWNQGELSRRLGKPQSVVSRMEDPSYGKLTIQTLLEVAEAFDVALWVRFISFPTFIGLSRDLSTASMRVESFEQSRFGVTPTEPAVVGASTVGEKPTDGSESRITVALGARRTRQWVYGLDSPTQGIQSSHWASSSTVTAYGTGPMLTPALPNPQLGDSVGHERRAQEALG